MLESSLSYLCASHTHTCTYSSRFFIVTLHPIGVGAIFPIIAALGLFYSMSFLLKTACIDPGILPRARQDELDYQLSLADESKCVCEKKEYRCIAISPRLGQGVGAARYMTVTVKGQQVKLKWCATCQIWRPPRASHCGLCNNCYGK